MSTNTDRANWTRARVVAVVIAVAMTASAFKMIVALVRAMVGHYLLGEYFDWVTHVIAPMIWLGPVTLMAALCWYAAFGSRQPMAWSLVKCALLGGFLFGGIGLVLGLYDPASGGFSSAASPHNAPLAIFTAPAGFIVGVLLGSLYGFLRAGASKPPRLADHEPSSDTVEALKAAPTRDSL